VNSLTDLNQLKKIKNNAVLSIKCNEKFIDKLNEQLELFKDKIINYRVVQTRDKLDIANNQTIDTIDLSVNPTEKFIELCKIKFTNDEILFEELTEICK
jgi:phospholipid N-methyltransferase